VKPQKWQGFGGCFNEAGWDALKVLDQTKQNLALNPGMKFWASPWTPPPWMKKSGTPFDNAGYDGGEMLNETNVLGALALCFSKFIDAYTAKGIPINAVCPQNEPGYTRAYPTCGWGPYNYDNGAGSSGDKTGTEYLSTFVADHLYPKLQAANPTTEIWFGTLSNDKTVSAYWNGMKTKAGTNWKTMIKGLGLQWNNVSVASSNLYPVQLRSTIPAEAELLPAISRIA
jgi:glucosylceramidase